MGFFSGTFGPLIFIFFSSKTVSGAAQGLASHWAKQHSPESSYSETQITAFWDVTKNADTI